MSRVDSYKKNIPENEQSAKEIELRKLRHNKLSIEMWKVYSKYKRKIGRFIDKIPMKSSKCVQRPHFLN